MKFSIKVKFSIFLASLLLLTVYILSFLVLKGIKGNQKEQYEKYLAQQAQTANVYLLQTMLSEAFVDPTEFLSSKGEEFSLKLKVLSNQLVVLYDMNGNVVSKKDAHLNSRAIKETLEYALLNKTAYLTEEEDLYYMAPLKIGAKQVGVVQFHYSLTENKQFYQSIRQLFINIGSIIFLISFILAYIYFNSFANGIILLEQMVGRIRYGDYETKVLRRKDEIGLLSTGIHDMSKQIKKTIADMESEQEKLSLAVDKLSKLDTQQKQFIGNVTHEFKTPLTSIKAYLDLLDMYPDDVDLLNIAKENIKSETIRLYEMVEKVLQLSRLEVYEFELKKEKLNLLELIKSVLNGLEGKLNKFNIKLLTELSESYIYADKDSMIIILMNLMDNAVKYNRDNGMITVKNYRLENEVIIEITDTGIGIPNDLVEMIFEPFYTVDKNRARLNGGVGLGLSLVKKYVTLHGGRISIVYTNETGTMFRIGFPAL